MIQLTLTEVTLQVIGEEVLQGRQNLIVRRGYRSDILGLFSVRQW